MSEEPVTLVCGLGRCGSSLVMQMLYEAGLQVTGEWPAFERHIFPQSYGPGTSTLLSLRPGCVYKLLNVHSEEVMLPNRAYRAIWLDRDLRQQEKSLRKIADTGTKNGWPMKVPKNFRKRARKSRQIALKRLQGMCGPSNVLILEFEQLIERPTFAVAALSIFLGLEHKYSEMMGVIAPREANALPDMSLEIALRR